MLLATFTWLLTMWRQQPCIQTDPSSYPQTFHLFCYTDIPVLYLNRGLSQGQIPLVDVPLEYPVLTTWLMEVARAGVNWFGGYSGPGVTALEAVRGAELFYALTAVMMFLSFLGLVFVHLKLHKPWHAMMIAASPLVVMGGLINWDMLVVLLASACVLAWSRGRVFGAGLLLGLAIATKLYPVFWLLPLFFLCLRTGKIAQFTRFAWGTVAAWLAVNVPAYFISPQNWLMFWTFNVDRKADLGSIWYVLQLARMPVPAVSSWVTVLLGLSGVALAVLILLAPRRPRLGQVLFLIIVAFLVLNKVYSPQYMLWLLPLLVLARPNWRDWLALTIAEGLYWAAIWGHLAQTMLPGDSGPDRLYWAAVLLRIAVELWLAGKVVRDIWYPQHDPIRNDWQHDDPDGGIFDHAPDVPWVTSLQRQVGVLKWPEPQSEPVDVTAVALASVVPGRPAPQETRYVPPGSDLAAALGLYRDDDRDPEQHPGASELAHAADVAEPVFDEPGPHPDPPAEPDLDRPDQRPEPDPDRPDQPSTGRPAADS